MSSGDPQENYMGGISGSSDQPADEDQLGFAPYVFAINEFLTSRSTSFPITISIEGDWGAGKSTFMNLLSKSLCEEQHIIVNFNPWRHEREESLWAAFAVEFLETVENESSRNERLRKKSRLAFRRFWQHSGLFEKSQTFFWFFAIIVGAIVGGLLVNEVISYISNAGTESPLFEFFISGSGAIVTFLALLNIWNKFKSPFLNTLSDNVKEHASNPDYKQRVPFIEEFHEDLETNLDVFLDTDQRVFVLIDDLDRCPVPQAANLMQSINLMIGRDSRIAFIIAMDRQRVAAGIASKYDEMLPVLMQDDDVQFSEHMEDTQTKLSFGYNFIEKFIQVPFLVPTPTSENIRGFLSGEQSDNNIDYSERLPSGDTLEEINEIFDSELMEKVAVVLENNPRQSIRFRNLYSLRALLVAVDEELRFETGDSGITPQQLAKFVTISIQYPQLLSEITRETGIVDDLEALASPDDSLQTERQDELRRWTQSDSLKDLVAFGLEKGPEYSLSEAPIEKLIKISPRTDRPRQTGRTLEGDDTFPWLNYPRDRWKVPCPNCGRKIHNNRQSFVQHWRESSNCDPIGEEELEQLGYL